MPLAREQRDRLARVLRSARRHGWRHDVYPNHWRSPDGETHIRFDSIRDELYVTRIESLTRAVRCRASVMPVESLDVALDVLGALGHLPPDERGRAAYRTITAGGRHAYMSTYCQHGLHDDCKRTCKACDAPCLCLACDHPPVADGQTLCAGRALPDVDDRMHDGLDALDGPATFAEAGQAFADLTDGAVTADRAAEVLSQLAGAGLIVSVAYHEEALSGPADPWDDLAAIFSEDT